MAEQLGTVIAPSPAPTAPLAAKSHKAKPKAAPVEPVTWWKVLEEKVISRGGSGYTLNFGKIINSGEYDIAHLTKNGAKLEAAEAPGWWLAAQEGSAE